MCVELSARLHGHENGRHSADRGADRQPRLIQLRAHRVGKLHRSVFLVYWDSRNPLSAWIDGAEVAELKSPGGNVVDSS